MDASGFVRIIAGANGPVQAITLRRVGSADVPCPAAVIIGGASEIIGDVQQTGDKIMLSDRQLNAAGWIEEPHHGDQVIYQDGRVTVVQGRAQVFMLESDRVFILRCIGG